MRNVYKILVVMPERKRPLGRARLRFEANNIKMDLIECERSGAIKDRKWRLTASEEGL
jgi:hypothetical protein